MCILFSYETLWKDLHYLAICVINSKSISDCPSGFN